MSAVHKTISIRYYEQRASPLLRGDVSHMTDRGVFEYLNEQLSELSYRAEY